MSIETVREKLKAAHKELCEAVQRQWNREPALKLSIPARPDHDTDLVIGEALMEADAILAHLQLSPDLRGLVEQWRQKAARVDPGFEHLAGVARKCADELEAALATTPEPK